ncbi:MAG: hypothetical protein A2Y38_25645 [Spirochaetes bacterium GWB1_59_5]|nr:MAG: hypothetical protein A2Y38_25645 [Spirochaetes bacterium GWB1_59_5]
MRLMKWWRASRKWRHCPHENIRGIYGDMINYVGGRRLVCMDCGNLLDGPVSIAELRRVS